MGFRSDLLQATRRSICEAAMRLFVERGVAATKMEDILNNSGMSTGSFYYLFKNKVDLAATLYLETQQQLFQTMLNELSKPENVSAREGIRALVQTNLQWAADNPLEMFYLAFCRELEVKNDGREKAAETEFYSILNNWLQTLVIEGEISSLSLPQYRAILLGPTEYLIRAALDSYPVLNNESDPAFKNHLLDSTELLAEAAWQGLRSHSNVPAKT
ncbi:MAG: TetR/AcrR family transcriptional regulator [Chloroflexi bacterium]|nr:TetR/AcrR family transcriptional regulator [Chloroflexota bacterium]OJV88321.1 MAG: hypothetical protein BGO39_23865 [Chloroflexi bacterium 54-19]